MPKDFRMDTWNDVKECAKDKEIFLFGAGYQGKKIWKEIDRYASCWKIKGFLDNDPTKQGRVVNGLEVFPPSILNDYNLNEIMILICCVTTARISEQLTDMGVENYFSVFHLDIPDGLRDTCFQPEIGREDAEWLYKRVCDERSREILNKIIEKRKTGFFDYTDIRETGSEYFIEDFFEKEDEEIFVDGGGYDGDTIEEFIDWTKGRYKRIYSFEPQKDKAEKIRQKLWKYGGKVKLFEKGLYENCTELDFCDGDELLSGRIGGTDTHRKIQTVNLDSVIEKKVTFIKMDIEGAELSALKGAAKMIQKYRPKMAICIYHKPEDLWEIPKYIDTLVPEYKFYIRHFGWRYTGTILYCK